MKHLIAVIAMTTIACAHHDHAKHDEQHAHHHMEKRFQGADEWAKIFDDPERDAWQKPEVVIDALELTPDMVVADLGAGTGYFTMRIARRVPQGAVLGVDVEPDMVRYLGDRAQREGLANVRPVIATVEDAHLPVAVDRILVVDTYHHIDNREMYFARLRDKLMPGGRIAVVDFTTTSPVGPPPEHRLAPEAVEKEMAAAGYQLVGAPALLPNQYVLLFTPRGRAISALENLKVDEDQQFGVNIVRRAIEEPLRMITTNAGLDAAIIVDKVKNGKAAFGFNAQTEEYGDMIQMGVIDPTKVVRTALTNAASVASLMLTTDCMVAERPKKDAPAAAPGGGGMGGMGGMDY